MSSISSSFARVPNSLATQITRQNVTSANLALLQAQIGLATQKRVLTPSDDPVAASIINVLDQRLETAGQRSRNLSHAASALGSLDSTLAEINNTLNEAKVIASSQVGVGSDPETRRSQAAIVGSLIDSLLSSMNADFAGLKLLGGNATDRSPIQSINGGYQYLGHGQGLTTDLGPGLAFPITLGADAAIGALSARVQGDVDLSPRLTDSTAVRDLRGPGGPEAALGSLVIRIDNGTPPPVDISVDLSKSETLGDVSDAIESAIRAADAGALGGAYPSGVGLNGERLQFAVSAGYQISFVDGANGTTARDLGIDGFVYDNANAVSTNTNVDLNPRITDRTLLQDLNPTQSLAYGDVVFRNGGRQGTVTLTPGMSIGEFKQAVTRLGLGVRVEIGSGGDTLNVINQVSGNKLSVEEAGSLAATRLGIRSLSGTTPTSVFNSGRGVRIADGQIDPTTGLPDANRNLDFEITLTDGSTFNVDLTAADITSVSAVIAKINADAASAGFGGVFTAGLVGTGNGIEFQDTSGGAGTLSVRSLNANAAADLGLLDGAFTAGATATLVSTDRAQVRVDSALTALIDLREALLANDSIGITFAGERIESALEKVIQAQGLVGGRARRVDEAQSRLEDTKLLDKSIKSNLQDLDFIEATTQFSLLQTQLQAGLQAAAAVSQLSLLNFLG